MKKRLLFLVMLMLVGLLVVACGNREYDEPAVTEAPEVTTETEGTTEPYVAEDTRQGGTLRIATPRGPAALGMLWLMEAGQAGWEPRNSYEFTLVGAPDEIPPMLVQGAIDIAAVPPNMASILFNNPNLDVQVVALTTMGVLHIVDATGTINSIEDLRGRTIYASGGGGTPEFILNHVLMGNGLTPGVDVTINFRAEHTEIAALIEGGLAEIAMLPEPFATTTLHW